MFQMKEHKYSINNHRAMFDEILQLTHRILIEVTEKMELKTLQTVLINRRILTLF